MGCLFSGLQGNNRYNLAVFLGAAKFHRAGNGCKNRVILANADAGSGMPGGAALADDDVAGNDVFAAESISRQAAGLRYRGRCGMSRLLFYGP